MTHGSIASAGVSPVLAKAIRAYETAYARSEGYPKEDWPGGPINGPSLRDAVHERLEGEFGDLAVWTMHDARWEAWRTRKAEVEAELMADPLPSFELHDQERAFYQKDEDDLNELLKRTDKAFKAIFEIPSASFRDTQAKAAVWSKVADTYEGRDIGIDNLRDLLLEVCAYGSE